MNPPETEPALRVLFLAHVMPRQPDDPMGAFLLHLAQALAPAVRVAGVAPHAPGLARRATVESIPISRFRYAPDGWECLAYTGEMHRRVGGSLANKLLFVFFMVSFFIEAVRAARTLHPDLLHAHWWLPGGLVGALVSRVTGLPLVITTHGTDVEQLRRTGWAARLARWVFSRASAITCGSTYLKDQLIALGVVGRAPLYVIPMPVNPLFVNAAALSENLQLATRNSNLATDSALGTRHSPLATLLSVARLSAQKSLDTLIAAAALVRAGGHSVEVIIAGDGPGETRVALESQTRALGMTDCVHLIGSKPQAELPALYAACDIFVLPSLREGTGLVLAEALLCGAPVISTNLGGVTDIVKDGETGLTFPERDAEALARAIARLLGDPAFAARLAKQGRAHVEAEFTPRGVADQFVNIYQTVLIQRGRTH